MPSTPSRQRSWWVVLAVFVLLGGTGAHAGEPTPLEPEAPEKVVDAEARRLFDTGLRYFNVGDYPAAIEHFKAAYQRSPVPGLLYNLAQAHRLSGQCGPALLLYRRYLASQPTGKNRQRSEARISEMEACLRASVEGGKQGTGEEDARAESPPGPPPIREGALAPAAPPVLVVPLQQPPRRDRRMTYALATGGAAAALGLVSGYFAWKADQAAGQTSIQSWQQPWDMRAAKIESTGIRDERLSIAAGVAALVTAGVTAWILLRD